MGKYALFGGYTSEAWAKMIDNPGDRAAAVRKVVESVGAKLETFFWSFGEDDYLAIIDAPDDVTAGAMLTEAAPAPGGGFFSVDYGTGVITFNTAQQTHAVVIYYRPVQWQNCVVRNYV